MRDGRARRTLLRMRYLAAALVPLFAVVACSSSSSGSSCVTEGNFEYQLTARNRRCPQGSIVESGTLQVQASGADIAFIFAGSTGGCPGPLKSCGVTLSCAGKDKSGNILQTLQIAVTFDAKGFSGTVTSSVNPPAVMTACVDDFDIKATRK